jgi:hypothetical protein
MREYLSHYPHAYRQSIIQKWQYKVHDPSVASIDRRLQCAHDPAHRSKGADVARSLRNRKRRVYGCLVNVVAEQRAALFALCAKVVMSFKVLSTVHMPGRETITLQPVEKTVGPDPVERLGMEGVNKLSAKYLKRIYRRSVFGHA